MPTTLNVLLIQKKHATIKKAANICSFEEFYLSFIDRGFAKLYKIVLS